MPPSILLIEDDPDLGALLEEELARAGYEARWCGDGESGLAEFHAEAPDLLLLDLVLPGRWGFEVLREVRRTSRVPVIVLTARLMGQDKVQALDLGADDYVTKPFWTEELLARIRAVLRRVGGAGPAAERYSFGKAELDTGARRLEVAGSEQALTPTEYALLVYLLQRPGRALPQQELTRAVLPSEEGNRQALQTQVSRLRRKLGPEGRRVATVWGIGYRFDL